MIPGIVLLVYLICIPVFFFHSPTLLELWDQWPKSRLQRVLRMIIVSGLWPIFFLILIGHGLMLWVQMVLED
ncbi:hypothetical protein LCGC14_2117880 [marine sediment metagenome]|uniref:Uncharacterized protein n=1 Tax=marine sediment metagenome TaxID=412755 RepID=A0A0F9ES67_9ZZZZ